MSDFVAFVLNGLDVLDLFGDAGVVRKHLLERLGAEMDVIGLLGEEVEESLLVRQKPLQESRHVV
jgi:hypothetical protein